MQARHSIDYSLTQLRFRIGPCGEMCRVLMAKITRPILAIAFALASVVLFFPSSSAALAQTPQSGSQPQQPKPEPEAGVDDNPTRAVFWSVRAGVSKSNQRSLE